MMRPTAILLVLCLTATAAVADVYVNEDTSVYGEKSFRMFDRVFSKSAQRSLDTENAYGQDCLLMYLMDDGEGSQITDYSGNDSPAALSAGTWTDDGVRIDEADEIISAAMPSLTGEWTVMMLVRSVNGSGQGPTNEHGAFFADSDNDFQLYRSLDRHITDEITPAAAASFFPERDAWDRSWHSVIYSVDDAADSACLYIDGDLAGCRDSAFDLPTPGAQIGIGNRVSGGRPIMATVRVFYAWSTAMDADDVASLHANPFQMFSVDFPKLYSQCTVSWEYEDDTGISGFYVYAAKTQLGFQLTPEHIVCVAGPQDRSCVVPQLDCHAYVGVTAFTDSLESELSDTPEFLCQ